MNSFPSLRPLASAVGLWLLLFPFAKTLAQTTTSIPCASRSRFAAPSDACNCLELPTILVLNDIAFGPDGVFEPLMNSLTWGNHIDYETPIMLRNFQWAMAANWNVAAAHHPTALDAFGRQPFRRCQPTETTAEIDGDATGDELLHLHQNVAVAYTILYTSKEFFPKASDYIASRLVDFGLDPTLCDTNDNACQDNESIATPWGLAWVVSQEIRQLALQDGWNADGSYNRKYNKIPFQDWRSPPYAYQPNLELENSWKPLLETNGIGYLTRQEHVTPHIGQTAKSFYLSNEDICDMKAPDPNYEYNREVTLVVDQTTKLLDNDSIKIAQVELFDNKVTLFAPLVSQYYRAAGYTLESMEHIQAFSMVVSALYESTIVVWKEKVRHDLIRPTTKVHDLLGDAVVPGYADHAIQTDLPASNWEPLVRTMPHSEYPSGSACLCTAAAGVLEELLGTQDFVDTIQTPLTMRKIENSIIEGPLTMEFASWKEIETICGQSRLWGGMHFSASVANGHDLCRPIGSRIYQAFVDLTAGNVPDFVMSVENEVERPSEVRCPDDFQGAATTNDKDETENGESSVASQHSSWSGTILAVALIFRFTR